MQTVVSSVVRELAGSISSRFETDEAGTVTTFEMAEPDRLTLKTLMRVVAVARAHDMRVSVGNRGRHVCFRVHAAGDAMVKRIEADTLRVEKERAVVTRKPTFVGLVAPAPAVPDLTGPLQIRLRDDTYTSDDGLDVVVLRLRKHFPTAQTSAAITWVTDARDDFVVLVKAVMLGGCSLPSNAFAQLTRGTSIQDIEFFAQKIDETWCLVAQVRMRRTPSVKRTPKTKRAVVAAASPPKKRHVESDDEDSDSGDSAFGDAEDS